MPALEEALQRLRTKTANLPALVTDEQFKQWEKARDEIIALVTALMLELLTGRITVEQWRRLMRVQIRAAHQVSYSLGMATQDVLDAGARLAIDTRIAAQLTFLTGFAALLTSTQVGKDNVSEAALIQRAKMYIEASQASLHAGAAQAAGIPLLPAYPGDGTTRCRVYCRCHWRIEQLDEGDWDCYWQLGYAEHCEHCPRRALAWSPLEIRNGVLQPYYRSGLFM